MSSLKVFEVVIIRGLSGFQILHLVFFPRAGIYIGAYSLFGSSYFREGKSKKITFLSCE